MEQPYTERIFSLCLFVAFVHFWNWNFNLK